MRVDSAIYRSLIVFVDELQSYEDLCPALRLMTEDLQDSDLKQLRAGV